MSPTLLSRLRQMIFTGVAYRSAQQTQEQERPMGAVMVRCPETGRDIPTGLVTDRKSFDATPVFFGRVHCPICLTEHEWFAKQTWVRGRAAPAAQRVALTLRYRPQRLLITARPVLSSRAEPVRGPAARRVG